MIRTGGKTLRALEHVDALGRKSPRQTVQYVQLQRGSARTQLCVRLSSCVQNCPLRSETAGCWLVCQGRRRAGKWVCVCVCVYESLFVYIRLHPFDFSRAPCAISTERHGWWWLRRCDLFHTPGCFLHFLHYGAAINVAVREKRGESPICASVQHPHTVQVKTTASPPASWTGRRKTVQVSGRIEGTMFNTQKMLHLICSISEHNTST